MQYRRGPLNGWEFAAKALGFMNGLGTGNITEGR